MTSQLGLFDRQLAEQRSPSFHVHGGSPTVAEVQAGEARAATQEDQLLEYFREHPRARLTRHDVHHILGFHASSAGRSLSNLAKRGELRKVLSEHRPGEGRTCHPYELVGAPWE